MLSKKVIALGLSLTILAATSTLVLAQSKSERYPTASEIQRLRVKLRQQIRSIHSPSLVRTPAERRSRESFVRVWSKVDPTAASFLGDWLGYEEGLGVYPSNTKGRVCLIYTAPQEAEFSQGTVVDGVIRTLQQDAILKEGNYLGIASVKDNQADIFVATPYNSPGPLKSARELARLSGTTAQEIERVVQEFNAAGCTTSRPSR